MILRGVLKVELILTSNVLSCTNDVNIACITIFLIFKQDLVHGFVNLQPLSCNSVNQIPESDTIAFIYITPSTSPTHTSLDMKLRSLTQTNQLTWDDNCSNSTLRMYNYLKDNRVELDQMVCSEATVITDSNMGIVTSSLNDGAFVLEVRSLAKRSPLNFEIFGMIPPVDGARDYYGANRFKPDFQSGWSPYRALPTTSFYPIPTYYRPDVQAPYSGKPTTFIDLTYNQTGPTHAAINTGTNVTTAISNTATNSSQVTYNVSNEEPPTTQGTTTYVEIHISNSTDVRD